MGELEDLFGQPIEKIKRVKHNAFDEEKALQMYHEGFSPRKIANALKTYPNAVRRFIKRRGLTTRDRSDAATSFNKLVKNKVVERKIIKKGAK